jgi:hypothetical protein
MRYVPYAQMFEEDDGYYINARSKSGLISKAKGLARKGEANQGGLLFDGDTKMIFGEIVVGGENNESVKYVKR